MEEKSFSGKTVLIVGTEDERLSILEKMAREKIDPKNIIVATADQLKEAREGHLPLETKVPLKQIEIPPAPNNDTYIIDEPRRSFQYNDPPALKQRGNNRKFKQRKPKHKRTQKKKWKK